MRRLLGRGLGEGSDPGVVQQQQEEVGVVGVVVVGEQERRRIWRGATKRYAKLSQRNSRVYVG